MKKLTPLFQAIIAFVAFLTGSGVVFNLLLSPVKEAQHRLEKNQVKMVFELKGLRADVVTLKTDVATIKQAVLNK